MMLKIGSISQCTLWHFFQDQSLNMRQCNLVSFSFAARLSERQLETLVQKSTSWRRCGGVQLEIQVANHIIIISLASNNMWVRPLSNHIKPSSAVHRDEQLAILSLVSMT